MPTPDPTYAVLTGDIVKSTDIPSEALHLLFQEMKESVIAFGRLHRDSVIGKLAVMQGDRWQILLSRPSLAERLMAYMEAVARKHGQITRIALAFGTVDRMDSKHITESTGEAFTLSGHALNELERPIYKKQYWRIEGLRVSSHRKILIQILGNIASSWTQPQAEAVLLVLQGLTTDQALAKLSIKQPAFAKRLSAAQWTYFEMTIREAEALQE